MWSKGQLAVDVDAKETRGGLEADGLVVDGNDWLESGFVPCQGEEAALTLALVEIYLPSLAPCRHNVYSDLGRRGSVFRL